MSRWERARARAGAGAWAAVAVAGCVGGVAWARAGDVGPSAPIDAGFDYPVAFTPAVGTTTGSIPPPTASTPTSAAPDAPRRAATTTTRPRTTTTTLPVPQPPPADAHEPTPAVVLGTLELPSIGVSAPLGEGVTLTSIDRGPGHWPGTALPGQVGNVVIAGHRVTHSRPFYDLDLLRPGDPLMFKMSDGTTWTYRLTSTEVVDDQAMYIVDQTPGRTATLFACHPKHSAAQRIVAHFTLVGP